MKRVIPLLMFGLVLAGRAAAQAVLAEAKSYYPKADVIDFLGYRPGEIFPIKIPPTGCPLVEVKIDEQPFWLTFDFGSSGGMLLSTAVENRIRYEFIRDLTTSFPDGSPRGRGKEILLARVEAFGKVFERMKCGLYDWKIYSSVPFEGAISLEYIEKSRFTLDYRGKKLGVTEKPFSDNLLQHGEGTVVPLLISPSWNRYGLYFLASVAGREVVIYVDTGSSRSFIDRSLIEGTSVSKVRNIEVCLSEIPVSIGGLDMTISNIRVSDIRRNTEYQQPVRMVIGSDLLRNFVISVDRTPGLNRLIVHK